MTSEWVVGELETGERLDLAAARLIGVSRSEAQRLIEGGHIVVDGRPSRASVRLSSGQMVSVTMPDLTPSRLEAEPIPLDVVFEDDDLLVINKPRGLVVHPAPGHSSGTLVNAVLAHADDLSGIGGEERPGIVHRLDKDTSGLLVVAKSAPAYAGLQAQLAQRTMSRIYTAVVWGNPSHTIIRVEAPIGRHPVDRKRMAVVNDGRRTSREAITELRLVEAIGPWSVLEARLQTGRTHQIRVHCQYIGHPVVGDPAYGGIRQVPHERAPGALRRQVEGFIANMAGQALHAGELAFRHPIIGEEMRFAAPLPPVLIDLLALLRRAAD